MEKMFLGHNQIGLLISLSVDANFELFRDTFWIFYCDTECNQHTVLREKKRNLNCGTMKQFSVSKHSVSKWNAVCNGKKQKV